jgi:hypothetical protein
MYQGTQEELIFSMLQEEPSTDLADFQGYTKVKQ